MKNKNKNILTDYQKNIINIPSTVLPCHLTKRSARANDFINFMNFTDNYYSLGLMSCICHINHVLFLFRITFVTPVLTIRPSRDRE